MKTTEPMTLPENKLLEIKDALRKEGNVSQININKEDDTLGIYMLNLKGDPCVVHFNTTEINMLAHYLNKNFDLSLVPSFKAAIDHENQKAELARLREVQDQLTTRNNDLREALKGARDTMDELLLNKGMDVKEVKAARDLATAYIDGDL